MSTLAVVAILAALLLATAARVRSRTERTVCLNHLRQIAQGVLLYAGDGMDVGPSRIAEKSSLDGWTAYKRLMKLYLREDEYSSPGERLFACPADRYHYDFTATSSEAYAYVGKPVYRQAWSDYSSYAFNGGNSRTNATTGVSYPGIAGCRLDSVREPARTVLVTEIPAFYCFSWHNPERPKVPHYFDNARNMAAFVDGHVSYTRFHYDPHLSQEAWQYDPPANYEYQWSDE